MQFKFQLSKCANHSPYYSFVESIRVGEFGSVKIPDNKSIFESTRSKRRRSRTVVLGGD